MRYGEADVNHLRLPHVLCDIATDDDLVRVGLGIENFTELLLAVLHVVPVEDKQLITSL